MKRLIIIILAAAILYLPSLSNFFSGDDFFHLGISRVGKLSEVLSFFSFEKNLHSASFYRPLPTQIFFFAGQVLFGLNPFGYHLLAIGFFILTVILAYKLAEKLTNRSSALLATFFYAFSVSHFVSLYWLSAFQELSLGVFYFGAAICWVNFLEKNKEGKHGLFFASAPYLSALLFFVLALLSKETAATFPLIAILLAVFLKKWNLRQLVYLLPMFLIEAVYLYLRLAKFGGVAGESYIWDFSPRVLNTFFWYGLWGLGAPEMWVDFIGPKLAVNPFLLKYYGGESVIIFISLGVFTVSAIYALIKFVFRVRNAYPLSHVFFGPLWFLFSSLPFLFLPWHKFPLELTVPLFGMAMFLGKLTGGFGKKTLAVICFFYLLANVSSYLLTYRTHWVISRAKVAERVVDYFKKTYPQFPESSVVYFYNDSAFIAEGWGASKQIATAISGSDGLRVLYKNPEIKVFYEDFNEQPPEGKALIRLGSKEFLGY
ncbi:MAG: glycosyltransferase family 39 protein [bacterium]|nr:glycosyltransferase family 39 protein [bacterium]